LKNGDKQQQMTRSTLLWWPPPKLLLLQEVTFYHKSTERTAMDMTSDSPGQKKGGRFFNIEAFLATVAPKLSSQRGNESTSVIQNCKKGDTIRELFQPDA
jgi:hypothetical protein